MTEYLTNRPRVLVVDDQPMSRTLIDAVLRTDNRYDVIAACNGDEGMEMARRVHPDLMLLDVVMPGMNDGFEVCRVLKADPLTRRMPIVLITAQANTVDRVHGIEAGADDFLAKPFNRIELLARVRSLIRIKSLNDQLDEVENVIYSLSRAIEAREGNDYDYQTDLVVRYVRGLGHECGLTDESLRILQQAAMLRDVGKIGLPDRIFNKPGRLNDQEQHVMERHTVLGEQIVSPLRSTAALLPIIRHHHERIDGKGYPDGLLGDSIPLGARIVAIADAYVAMLSQRPYRAALPPSKALDVLISGAGKQWDENLVELFVRWVRSLPAHQLSLK